MRWDIVPVVLLRGVEIHVVVPESSGMTVFCPVIWLNITYAPGVFAANCFTFHSASSRLAAVAFHSYVPSFCILKISKGSSTGGSFPGLDTIRNWRAPRLNAVCGN